ncbi:MAG TPA: molybdopterin cofactor-binding domain-containing protein [Pseudonocardiaceae bacterium]|nr:molybdopterin cofactor-binding domain-containing protein [Pseudonocardiaceae bacterium]
MTVEFCPDGTVLVRTGKVELGQGVLTALAQIVADELGVDIDRIRMAPTKTGSSPDEGYTAGSLSIQQSGARLRQAAAELRATARDEHRVVGQNVPRMDIPGKAFGTRRYVQDLRLPGQLFGRVLRPPSRGARLVHVDDVPGVVAVVRDGDFVGVVAEREEIAVTALDKACRWAEHDTLPDERALPSYLMTAPSDETVLYSTGAAGTPTLSTRFSRPYLAHASIAPSCAIALWDNGKLTVWSHTQGVYQLRAELARWLELEPDDVTVEHVEGAGCYGHNGADDVAGDAALLARAVPGRPVQVVWSRQDELGWAPFGPAMVVGVDVSLDADGAIRHWRQEIWSNGHSSRPSSPGSPPLLAALHQGEPSVPSSDPPLNRGGGSGRNAVPGYDLPGVTVVSHVLREMPLRTSAMRALGAHLNVYAIESVIDELAERAGQDPIAFRLDLLSDPRARDVLTRVALAGDWGAAGDRGVGYARYKNTGGYCAVVADVSAETSVRVTRLTIAVDVGQVVNPDGVRNQIEGGALQSLSWTTKEQVRFDRRDVTSRTWEEYPILGFTEVPPVHIELIDRPDAPSLGAGEASIGPTAAAIGNAVRAALGISVRTLPLTPENVIAAL